MFNNNCFETSNASKILINDTTLKFGQIGNADLQYNLTLRATFDYFWMHAMISGKTYRTVQANCGFNGTYTKDCDNAMNLAIKEKGNVDDYNIYAPICRDASSPLRSSDPVYTIKHINPHTCQISFVTYMPLGILNLWLTNVM